MRWQTVWAGTKGGACASSLALEVLEGAVQSSVEDMEAAAESLAAKARLRWTDGSEVDEEARQTEEITLEIEASRTLGVEASEFDVASLLPATTVMRLAAQKASHEVFREATRDPALEGMGTTMTAILYEGDRMHMVHAGDSRADLFRDGRIRQLTDENSWTAEPVRRVLMTEAEANESQFRHVITRSIGYEREVDVDSSGVVVQAGDCFLLCSDGLSNFVQEAELRDIVERCWYHNLPQTLVDLANARGGDGNITVVVVYAANHLES
ncbi:MAG: serine/threonine-protein phosphatase [Myxococcales bacterium]|nr:serine/threonine-protein phosphatase [Myxococcales bacterium]